MRAYINVWMMSEYVQVFECTYMYLGGRGRGLSGSHVYMAVIGRKDTDHPTTLEAFVNFALSIGQLQAHVLAPARQHAAGIPA